MSDHLLIVIGSAAATAVLIMVIASLTLSYINSRADGPPGHAGEATMFFGRCGCCGGLFAGLAPMQIVKTPAGFFVPPDAVLLCPPCFCTARGIDPAAYAAEVAEDVRRCVSGLHAGAAPVPPAGLVADPCCPVPPQGGSGTAPIRVCVACGANGSDRFTESLDRGKRTGKFFCHRCVSKLKA